MNLLRRPLRLLFGLWALAMAVAGPLVLGAPSVAGAVSYTPPAIETQPITGPSDPMTLNGAGFIPNSTVQIFIDGNPIGTTTVSPDGTFTFNFTSPPNTGSFQVSATDGVNDLTTTFRVVSGGGGGGGGLPYTGSSSSSWLVRVGVGLLAVGAVLVALVRSPARRRSDERSDIDVNA